MSGPQRSAECRFPGRWDGSFTRQYHLTREVTRLRFAKNIFQNLPKGAEVWLMKTAEFSENE